jgi:cysteine synthase A
MAEEAGLLHPHTGSRIFEGTVGSTGISMATMARALGYQASERKTITHVGRHG